MLLPLASVPSTVRSALSAAHNRSASGSTIATRLPSYRQGMVTNFVLCRSMSFNDIAKEISLSAVPRPGSTVIDLVAASARGNSLAGVSPLLLILPMRLATKACWRLMRPMSEPSPMPCRRRT